MAKFKNIIGTPFAEKGIRADLPDTPESSGRVNVEQGYTANYQKPPSKGGYYIEMPQFNQILYETQAAIKDVQTVAVLAVNNKLPDDTGAVTLTKADIGLGNLDDGGYIMESAIGAAGGVAGLSIDLELINTLVTNEDGVYLKHGGGSLTWGNDEFDLFYGQLTGSNDATVYVKNFLASQRVTLTTTDHPSYISFNITNLSNKFDTGLNNEGNYFLVSYIDNAFASQILVDKNCNIGIKVAPDPAYALTVGGDMMSNLITCSYYQGQVNGNMHIDTVTSNNQIYLQYFSEGMVIFGKNKHAFNNNDGSVYHSGNMGIKAAIDPAYSLNVAGDLNSIGSAKIHGILGVSRDWVYGYNLAVNNALLIAGRHLRFGEVDEPTKLLKVAHGAIDCYYEEVSGGRFDVVLGNGSGALSRTLVVNKYGLYINSEPDSAYSLTVGGGIRQYTGQLTVNRWGYVDAHRIVIYTTNQDGFLFRGIRHNAGNEWNSAFMRIERRIDLSSMSYLDFYGDYLETNKLKVSYSMGINTQPDSAYSLKVSGNAHFSGVIQCQGLTTLVINPGQDLPPAQNYPYGTIIIVQTGPNHSYLMVSLGTIWRSVRVDN